MNAKQNAAGVSITEPICTECRILFITYFIYLAAANKKKNIQKAISSRKAINFLTENSHECKGGNLLWKKWHEI